MRIIRILALVPYPSIQETLNDIANEWGEVQISAMLCTLRNREKLLSSICWSDYDIVLTQESNDPQWNHTLPLPVVEIQFSCQDIISAIHLAQSTHPGFAILTTRETQSLIKSCCNIIQCGAPLIALSTEQSLSAAIDSVQQQGCSLLLVHPALAQQVQQQGINIMQISYSKKSVLDAVRHAISIASFFLTQKRENEFYQLALGMQNQEIYLFDQTHELIFTSEKQKNSYVLQWLRKKLSLLEEQNVVRCYKDHEQYTYSAAGQKILSHDVVWYCFAVTRMEHLEKQITVGIQYKSRETISEHSFHMFFYTELYLEIRKFAEKFAAENTPVLILGEIGTGKDELANSIFLHSKQQKNPYYIIDCGILHKKSWKFLMEHPLSPIYDTGSTLYFKNFIELESEQIHELYALTHNSNLSKRNRLMFSYEYGYLPQKENSLCNFLKNDMGCFPIILPTLREDLSNLPAMIGLYLNHINVVKNRQIMGVEPEGIQLLQEFRWPQNYTQFKRILDQATVLASDSYITAQQLRFIISNEKTILPVYGTNQYSLDISRTLEEMQQEIITAVLQEEHMNQTSAAKRLGISRTTLWRLLNKNPGAFPKQ
ncbi:MAG: PrpR N-terminal domain-containing protein [Eubacteriales bacterium]|jgi:transcriptional regulator with PAS, ATPase and Fis domain